MLVGDDCKDATLSSLRTSIWRDMLPHIRLTFHGAHPGVPIVAHEKLGDLDKVMTHMIHPSSCGCCSY